MTKPRKKRSARWLAVELANRTMLANSVAMVGLDPLCLVEEIQRLAYVMARAELAGLFRDSFPLRAISQICASGKVSPYGAILIAEWERRCESARLLETQVIDGLHALQLTPLARQEERNKAVSEGRRFSDN